MYFTYVQLIEGMGVPKISTMFQIAPRQCFQAKTRNSATFFPRRSDLEQTFRNVQATFVGVWVVTRFPTTAFTREFIEPCAVTSNTLYRRRSLQH